MSFVFLFFLQPFPCDDLLLAAKSSLKRDVLTSGAGTSFRVTFLSYLYVSIQLDPPQINTDTYKLKIKDSEFPVIWTNSQ